MNDANIPSNDSRLKSGKASAFICDRQIKARLRPSSDTALHFKTSRPTLELVKPTSLSPCLAVGLKPLRASMRADQRKQNSLCVHHLHVKSTVRFSSRKPRLAPAFLL